MNRPVSLLCAALICIATGGLSAAETTTGSLAREVAADGSEWDTFKWGKIGVAHMKSAPYPDDSRTTGFVSKRGVFPYEGHYDDDRVVFVVPQGFKAGPGVDLVVHFHGHSNEAQRAAAKYRVGEQLEASGRNAIVIIPQGPKDAPDSGCGKLEKPGAFAAFVREAIEVLDRNSVVRRGAKPGNIILSGHSGAYRVIGMILDHGGLSEKIREAWLFDAAYGQIDELAAPFAPPDGCKTLRSIFTDHLATENVEIMSRLSLAGSHFAVVQDDLLTTKGTGAETVRARKFRSLTAGAGRDELPALLRRERVLFVYTSLAHDEVMMGRDYFEHFARESPNLRAK